MQIKDIKKQFPWFKNNPHYVYMDSAATTLKPQVVIDRIVHYYSCECTNPHNTDSTFTSNVYNEIEKSRETIASFIHADSDEIAFNSGATEGLNLIANGLKSILKKDDEVLLTYGEHASNILPWMNLVDEIGIKIKYAGEKYHELTPQELVDSINSKTKVVAFSSGHNLTGQYFNDANVCQLIKQKYPHVLTVVDATQSIQHHEINVKKSGCDFLVCSGHKIFGPTGIGLVYIKKILQNQINPLRYGGGMNFKIEEQEFEPLNNIHKYEGGTQNVAGILGWSRAVKFFNEIGYDQIEAYEKELSQYALSKLSTIKNIIIYNEASHSTTIAFNYDGVFCQDLASYLGSKGIIVRSGLSCAKLYCNLIDTKALIRASLYVYNTKEDIDYLYEVLKNYKKGDELNELI